MERCPFCQSTRRSAELTAKEMSQGSREAFTYFICGGCGSVYIAAIPENIGKYYDGYYSLDTVEARPPPVVWLKRLVAWPARQLMRPGVLRAVRGLLRNPPAWTWPVLSPNLQSFLYLCPSRDARIIDVGCGNGAFVANLRRLGYLRAHGVDPFIEADRLQATKGYVATGDVATVTGLYDIVVMNHSFEHMPSPLDVLSKARALLADGGTLIVHIPNIESPEFLRYRENWWCLHAPRHFVLPTRKGMEAAARKAGLVIRDRIFTGRFDNYFYSREHSLDIAHHDPGSWLTGGKECMWAAADVRVASRKAMRDNASGAGDWVSYYLEAAADGEVGRAADARNLRFVRP